jgi:PIN domain nuclease of toxin-antitoxin system
VKLLLDTHVWLWALHEPSNRHVREELKNPANELWLSRVSTWERLLLNAKGKIRLPAASPVEVALWRDYATPLLLPADDSSTESQEVLPFPHRMRRSVLC